MAEQATFHLNPEEGRTYCLDLSEDSVNLHPILDYNVKVLPVYDMAYGYYKAGSRHFTQRGYSCQLFQVFMTHKGTGRLIVDRREYLMPEGTIAFMNLSVPHRYETHGEYWEYEWVNFWGHGLEAYYSMINPDGFTVYHWDDHRALPTIMKEIHQAALSVSLKSYMHMASKCLQLLDELLLLSSEIQQLSSPSLQNVSAAIHYVDENYAHPISIQELSDVACLSKYYFIRAFSRVMGVTPYRYINSVRLTKAKQLLDSTTLTVEEIGWRTGYEGAKNLIRSFKTATGITPNQYRNKSREL